MKQKRADNRIRVLLLLLFVLSAAATAGKLFVGFDIDEGYAIAMPYRLLRGDTLFGRMWEIHQTSALLPALLMAPFVKLTGGVTGIVLYLRFATLLIHLLMTALFYRILKGLFERDGRGGKLTIWIGTLIYFNLQPKWLMTVDFSMQQLWGMTLLLYGLYLEDQYKKTSVCVITGIALSLTVLGYVGMVVLYPALLWCYLATDRQAEIKTRIKKCIVLTLTCLAMAGLFLGFVLSRISPETFWKAVPQVFADGTHSLSPGSRLSLYASQWLNVGKQWAVFLAAGGAFAAVVRIIKTYVFKRQKSLEQESAAREKSGKNDNPGNESKMTGILEALTFGVIAVTSLLILLGRFAGIQMGPFHFQSRLLLIAVLLLFVLCNKEKREGGIWKKEGAGLLRRYAVLSIVSFLGILLFSNVGPASSASYLAPGLALLFTAYACHGGGDSGQRAALAILFLLSVLMCKGFFVRYTEYFPADLLQKRIAVTAGPQKGIFLLPEDEQTEKEQREMIEAETAGGKSAMLLSTDQILDLSMQGDYIGPSTISTPAFNGQWITYLTDFAPSLPDVVFISKNTVDDREKFFAQNELGLWLAERYDVEGMKENDSICRILKKK